METGGILGASQSISSFNGSPDCFFDEKDDDDEDDMNLDKNCVAGLRYSSFTDDDDWDESASSVL